MLGWGEVCKCEVDKIIYEMEKDQELKKLNKGLVALVFKIVLLGLVVVGSFIAGCYGILS